MKKKLEEISRERIETRLRVTTEQLQRMQEIKENSLKLKGQIDDRIYNAMIAGYEGEIKNLQETKEAYGRVLKEFSH